MIDAQLQKFDELKEQWLPFDFVEEEEKQKIAEEIIRQEARREALENLPYYDRPRNDNERLLNFQYEYRHGSQEALGKMYGLCVNISLKFICTIGKQNRHVKHMQQQEKEIKAADAASYITEQFITREDFKFTKNAPGYLFLRVLHELFYQRKVDQIVDFVDLATFFKEGTEEEE